MTGSPDGTVWFTDHNFHVGRLTPEGAVDLVPLMGVNDVPAVFTDIVAGPDAVWFTMAHDHPGDGSEFLGRVALDARELVSRNIPGVRFVGLARADDGVLWIVDVNKVLRIAVDGTMTSFPAPGGLTMLGKPTIGPDGNLWMVGQEPAGQAMQMVRLTPTGSYTAFPLPSGWTDFSRIAVGPDGALWVAGQARHSVLRMSTQGAVLEEISVGDSPSDLTRGPGGGMWFTGAGSIGRIDA